MASVRSDLPTGTVTFVFTDVEGSTRLLDELGAERYAEALAEHRRLIREAFNAHGGVEVDTQGDAFFIAFPTAPGALAAAEEMLGDLAPGRIRVRMGIHTGTPYVGEEGYVGIDVNRAARIAACGHGGQVLVSASTAALLGGEKLHDLGEHRLKDLSAPERISQLGEDDFPPLKSLHRTNLPVSATLFLGRTGELADLGELLGREDVRLVTLTGPGGTGKTRLALHAAAEAAGLFPAGVFWVPLAALRESELVLEAAARALGAEDEPAHHIAGKRLLLLFDNFEQVVDAAPDLSALLAACPNLHLLVTSRELLLLPGEQAYPVPPLEPQEGIELFLARARAADPAFVATPATPELCERLDNLPLALELAAARIRVLSPEQLLPRLGQRPRSAESRPRRRSATADAARDDRVELRAFGSGGTATLCPARRLPRRLHAGNGGGDLRRGSRPAPVARRQEPRPRSRCGSVLDARVDHGVRRGAAGRIQRRRATATPARRVFPRAGEEAEPHVHRGSTEWLGRLQREHDNLRAALDGLGAAGEGTLVLRLAAALPRFWEVNGHVEEGRRRLDDALRSGEGPKPVRAKALNAAADLAATAGEIATSRSRAEEALVLHRSLENAAGVADSLWQVGYALAEEGDWATGRRLLEESIELFRSVGDEHSILWATRTLAFTYAGAGELERARALHENLLRARALGDRAVEATLLGALAMIAVGQSRVRDARTLLIESTRGFAEVGNRLHTATNLCRVAAALAASGDETAALRLLSFAEASFEEMGAKMSWVAAINDETLAVIRDRLDDAAFEEAWEQGRRLSLDDATAFALESLD